jgi:hypothetical protein
MMRRLHEGISTACGNQESLIYKCFYMSGLVSFRETSEVQKIPQRYCFGYYEGRYLNVLRKEMRESGIEPAPCPRPTKR